MLKPRFLNIIFYIFVKYVVFYVFMMFKNHIFTLIEINELKTGSAVFFYLWTFLFLPVVCCVVFSAPIYYTFKLKRTLYFVLSISAILMAEYFLYTYFASESDLKNGIYNGVISILFLLLFFYNYIPVRWLSLSKPR